MDALLILIVRLAAVAHEILGPAQPVLPAPEAPAGYSGWTVGGVVAGTAFAVPGVWWLVLRVWAAARWVQKLEDRQASHVVEVEAAGDDCVLTQRITSAEARLAEAEARERALSERVVRLDAEAMHLDSKMGALREEVHALRDEVRSSLAEIREELRFLRGEILQRLERALAAGARA